MTKTEQRIWREKTAVRIEEIAKQREFLESLHRLVLQVADTVEAKLVELHARSGHEKAGALDPVETIHSAAVRSEQAMRVRETVGRREDRAMSASSRNSPEAGSAKQRKTKGLLVATYHIDFRRRKVVIERPSPNAKAER